jgi:SAM-dependent methyltransferase
MTHWARVVMQQRTDEFVADLDAASMEALEISGEHWKWRAKWRDFRSVNFPEFDICRDAIYGSSFDIIFAEQVLEHVPYPYRAVRNVYRMLKSGGYFLATVPFLIKIHEIPIDCSRWTAAGLAHLLEECGFDRQNISVDSWGNRACINANFDEWVEYDAAVHSLENEPDFPIVAWATARK